MAFYSVHKSSMSLKLASNNVFWQSKVHFGYPIKGFFGILAVKGTRWGAFSVDPGIIVSLYASVIIHTQL